MSVHPCNRREPAPAFWEVVVGIDFEMLPRPAIEHVIALFRQDPDIVPELPSTRVSLGTRVSLAVVQHSDGVRKGGEGGLEVCESRDGAGPRAAVCGVCSGLDSHPFVFGDDVDVDLPRCARELLAAKACSLSQSRDY